MINREIIQSKSEEIVTYIVELEPHLELLTHEIIHDLKILRSVERLFQLVTDTAIGINSHLITELNLPVPNDFSNTFITLGENHILSMEFAQKIAKSVGLRNLIVHKYGKVDLKRMVDDIKADISDYTEYLKNIKTYIDSLEIK